MKKGSKKEEQGGGRKTEGGTRKECLTNCFCQAVQVAMVQAAPTHPEKAGEWSSQRIFCMGGQQPIQPFWL